MPERVPIHTPEMQIEKAKMVTTLGDYLDLDDYYFAGKSYLMPNFAAKTLGKEGLNLPPEYFKLAALISIQTAQFGWERQDGLVYRLNRGEQKEPFSPRNLLHMVGYMGRIISQAVPLKESIAQQVEALYPDVSMGVYGLSMWVEDGKVDMRRVSKLKLGSWVRESVKRITSPNRPICLPDEDLNNKLAGLKFSKSDVENMSDDEFFSKIYPKAKKMLSGFVDISPIFETSIKIY